MHLLVIRFFELYEQVAVGTELNKADPTPELHPAGPSPSTSAQVAPLGRVQLMGNCESHIQGDLPPPKDFRFSHRKYG